LIGSVGELAHRTVRAPEGDRIAFHLKSSPVADHLKHVLPRRFTRGGNERAGRAVLILHKRRNIVFYLDVVMASETAERPDANRHSAKPLPQV